ncbi:MAG: ELM1/GtrOC1 family putative glycosyltransferase [Pseudomonadota bacterium]
MLVWIIIDHKTGNANQAIAVAKALGFPYETKFLKYNALSFLPNRLKFNSLLGIDSKKELISAPFPDVVISSGRKTAVVSNYIKKRNPKTIAIHLMKPDLPFENFDLVCLPLHDRNSQNANISNILFTIGAPAFLDKSSASEITKILKKKISQLHSPLIALMIGGKTKESNYTKEELKHLLYKTNEIAIRMKACVLITTSRRTDIDITEEVNNLITVPHYFYDWHNPNGDINPYLGFLSLADYFIITGESVSICSEILTIGKPIYIYRKERVLYKKHMKFLDYLFSLSYIKYLDSKILEKWDYPLLAEAERISEAIKEKLINVNSNISS